jgi:hypothetical protein
MEKLTIKLIKNKNGQIKYSVLEQSASIERGEFEHYIIGLEHPYSTSTYQISISSCSVPEFYYPDNVLYIRGENEERDTDVNIVDIYEEVDEFLDLLTKENIEKIKESLAEIGIKFKFVTNLFSKNITSKF